MAIVRSLLLLLLLAVLAKWHYCAMQHLALLNCVHESEMYFVRPKHSDQLVIHTNALPQQIEKNDVHCCITQNAP